VRSLPPEEIVGLLLKAHAAGDRDLVLRLLAPEVEVRATPDGPAVAGIEAVRAWLDRQAAGQTRRVELAAHEIVADGDRVLVQGRIRTIDRGRMADSPGAWAFTVRDGLVRRMAPLARALSRAA
jgi:ketosteroid isomerase-like protein